MGQLIIQAKGVGLTIVWTAVVAFIAFKIADLIVGLRVSDDEQREGLDIVSARRKRLQPLVVATTPKAPGSSAGVDDKGPLRRAFCF